MGRKCGICKKLEKIEPQLRNVQFEGETLGANTSITEMKSRLQSEVEPHYVKTVCSALYWRQRSPGWDNGIRITVSEAVQISFFNFKRFSKRYLPFKLLNAGN
jgi:hypothetical protein